MHPRLLQKSENSRFVVQEKFFFKNIDFLKWPQDFIFCPTNQITLVFKASALWANAFYKSKCPSVRLSVCSVLRYSLNVFLPPLPEVGCPIFLEIRNPWGNVMKISGLRLKHLCLEVVLNCQRFNLFVKPSLTKVCFKHTQNVFQDIPKRPN